MLLCFLMIFARLKSILVKTSFKRGGECVLEASVMEPSSERGWISLSAAGAVCASLEGFAVVVGYALKRF